MYVQKYQENTVMYVQKYQYTQLCMYNNTSTQLCMHKNTSTLNYVCTKILVYSIYKTTCTLGMTFFIGTIFLNMNHVHNNTISVKITTK